MAHRFDFLVLGGGVAGLTFALEAAQHGTVAVLTKRGRDESNTNYAQGGIAAVLATDDTFERHVQDTLVAGRGAEPPRRGGGDGARRRPTRLQGADGAGRRVHPQDARASSTSPARAATPRRRVVHAGDITGREVERALLGRLRRAAEHHLLPRHHRHRPDPRPAAAARASGRCLGAYVLHEDGAHRDLPRQDDGAGHRRRGQGLPLHHQPRRRDRRRRGDGVPGRARRSPTWSSTSSTPPACSTREAKNFLITEALRGEGGVLRLRDRRDASWSATTRWPSWRRATWWPAPSTPR